MFKNKELNSDHVVQPKLTVGSPDDKYEKEADTIADKVMNMSNDDKSIQRKSNNEKDGIMMKPLSESITPVVQKKESGENPTSSKIESSLNNSKGKGQSLPEDTLGFMNRSFGSDFSDVKIHTDSEAIQMNQNLGAKAFANGNDVYFNQGNYNPNSQEGKGLLAHELVHTIQQRQINNNERSSLQRKIEITGGNFSMEKAQELLQPEIIKWHKEIQSTVKKEVGEQYILETHLGFSETEAISKGMEILLDMDDAKNYDQLDVKFSYLNYDQLVQEVLFRLSIIHNIKFSNTGIFARYPNETEAGLELSDDSNWQEANEIYAHYKPSGFEKKGSISPSDAINKLYQKRKTESTDERIVVDCSTLLGIIHYRSIEQVYGKEALNNLENENTPFTIGSLKGIFQTSQGQKKHTLSNGIFTPVFISSLEDLVPGDRVEFINHSKYKEATGGKGLWNGEFAIYLGKKDTNLMFEGFGITEISYDAIIELMFTETRKVNPNEKIEYQTTVSTVDKKIPGLRNTIYRINTKKLQSTNSE